MTGKEGGVLTIFSTEKSKYRLFLEGVHCEEKKLSFESIFLGTSYFLSNISS